MIKNSPNDYIATNVFSHWNTVKSQMEGNQGTLMDQFTYNPKYHGLPFGGDPTKARRITSLNAVEGAHTFKIRTENPKSTTLVSLLNVHALLVDLY